MRNDEKLKKDVLTSAAYEQIKSRVLYIKAKRRRKKNVYVKMPKT